MGLGIGENVLEKLSGPYIKLNLLYFNNFVKYSIFIYLFLNKFLEPDKITLFLFE